MRGTKQPPNFALATPGDGNLPGWLGDFLKSIHSGETSPDMINAGYFDHVSNDLKAAVAEGLGGLTFGADDYRNTLKAYFDQNVCAFSCARSLEENKLFTSFLTGPDGNPTPWNAFRDKVSGIVVVRNVGWLETDHIQTIACAQAADHWQNLQQFEALEYRTTEGEHVCPICGGLNGLVLLTSDPRWRIIFIPNHNRCQCNIVPAAGDAVPTTDNRADKLIKAAKIPPAFKFNPGIEKLAFTDDYPYIDKFGDGKLSELDAEKNYGLRSGEKMYATDDLPSFKPTPNQTAADTWWKEMAGKDGAFELNGVDDIAIKFDQDFYTHVIDENPDERWKIISRLKDVVEQPDEVWSNRIKNKLSTIYLKYYETAPVAVITSADKVVRAVTMYEVKKHGKVNFDALTNMRKGILKYKNR